MSSSTAVSQHPSSAVLLDHVTGTLNFAHHLVVATHLLSCRSCQKDVIFWEKVGSALVTSIQMVEPPTDLLDRCLVTVAQGEARRAIYRMGQNEVNGRLLGGIVLPPVLEGLNQRRLRWLAPGIRHSTLWRGHGSTLHLIRVEAGVTLPAHRHRGLELTCVLSGAYKARGNLYTVGDVSEEDANEESDTRPEEDHRVVAEPGEGCVCIMATTGRLRFSGWTARMLQIVMPF